MPVHVLALPRTHSTKSTGHCANFRSTMDLAAALDGAVLRIAPDFTSADYKLVAMDATMLKAVEAGEQ